MAIWKSLRANRPGVVHLRETIPTAELDAVLANRGAIGSSGFGITSLSVSEAYAQMPERPEFEVASVRPHSSQGSANVSIARDPGRLTYTNITVRGLIREAYGLKLYPPRGEV